MRGYKIPVPLIQPHVVQHLFEMKALEMGAQLQEIDGENMTIGYGPQFVQRVGNLYSEYDALGFRAGLDGSLIKHVALGTRDVIMYQTADKIISVGMNRADLWRTPELLPYYLEGAEIPPDPLRPIKCACRACPDWFEVPYPKHPNDSAWKKQRFCSHYCSVREGQFRRGERPEGGRKRWRNQYAEGVIAA
jgi:hypothetical protein